MDQPSPPTHVFREEIHHFIRVTNALMEMAREPHRLSKEERAVVAKSIEKLHLLLTDQQPETANSRHTLAFQ